MEQLIEQPRAIKNRLTIVEQVYHQQVDQEPVQITTRHTRELESAEQCYIRCNKAGETSQALDLGWVVPTSAGTIIIKNTEGQFLSKKPTDEERADLAKRVLIVFDEDSPNSALLVHPGDSLRFSPTDPERWRMVCAHETASYIIHVVPK